MTDESPPQRPAGNERILTLLEINVGAPVPSIDLRTTETDADLTPAPADVAGTGTASSGSPTTSTGSDDGSRYEEHGVIGRGGLGEVVDVFDLDLRRHVALKRALRQSALDVRRLVAEAQVTAQLEHPNIPAVHAIGIDDGNRPYFTMARIDGLSLADLIDRRRHDGQLAQQFSTPRLLRVFLQIGYAIAFAHERGVLHRDIKPANIMLGRFGEVRVMDWGLARVLGNASADTDADGDGQTAATTAPVDVDLPEERAHAVVGTPGYMAPEQCESDPLDERADIYALGATLYEMLSGHRPTGVGTSLEVIGRTVKGALTQLTEVAPQVGPEVGRVVHRALERDPADRYRRVLDMLLDIEAVLEGREPPSFGTRAGTLSRVGRWYMARNWRSARLRPIDIDLAMFGAMAAGGAIGWWLAGTLTAWWWPWLALVLGILASLPFTIVFARRGRPDDPDRLGTVLLEGVRTDSSLASHAPSSRAGLPVDPDATTADAAKAPDDPTD